MKGILPIVKNSGCDYHRINMPLKYLGLDTTTIPKKSTADLLKETKLLLFNRIPENPMEKVLQYKFKYGFKIVQDMDDYWELNVNHPMYITWRNSKMQEEIFKWIPNADAVTVTTARLADKVRPYNKNVHIIPNGLPFDDDQFTSTRTESELTRFIYAGGDSHVRDVDVLRYPFTKVKNLSKAKFILAGYNDRNIPVWEKMQRVFALTNDYGVLPWQPILKYMKVYENADVSLAPLESNIFTPYKSNLKILEAGCKNIPIICSNVPPYSDEPIKSGVRYANNTKDWVYWINYFYKNPSFAYAIGHELGEYVRTKYDLRKINEYRKQLYEKLME